jgi:GNAT superfamily N-acetyltransferase
MFYTEHMFLSNAICDALPVARREPPTSVEVRAVTAADWEDVVALFTRPGPRGGVPIPSQCWCQYWHTRGGGYWDEGHRERLERQLREGRAPALLATAAGGATVGWCRLGPRSSFERLAHSRTLAPVDDEPVWSIVCFYVHPAAKRRGVASALLDGAVELAAAAGAPALEAYAARPEHPNIDSYTGYLPMYLAAGFEHVRDGGRRVIVRRRLLRSP